MPNDPVRVLEIRASSNGWVITTFRYEANYMSGDAAYYKTYVAETGETASKLVKEILGSEAWDISAAHIPPARGKL